MITQNIHPSLEPRRTQVPSSRTFDADRRRMLQELRARQSDRPSRARSRRRPFRAYATTWLIIDSVSCRNVRTKNIDSYREIHSRLRQTDQFAREVRQTEWDGLPYGPVKGSAHPSAAHFVVDTTCSTRTCLGEPVYRHPLKHFTDCQQPAKES